MSITAKYMGKIERGQCFKTLYFQFFTTS